MRRYSVLLGRDLLDRAKQPRARAANNRDGGRRPWTVRACRVSQGITEIGRAAMVVEGEEVPDDVLRAEEKAKDHAAPHVNFYDPSVYNVRRRFDAYIVYL